MPSFSTTSKQKLNTCDQALQTLMNEAIKFVDFAVIWGWRDPEEQHKAFLAGNSKLDSGKGSLHETYPSRAVDIAPSPIDWKDRDRFILLAGIILGIANRMNIPIRWGGDWNGNFSIKDERFQDLGHFELRRLG